jgi:hypothetical protein
MPDVSNDDVGADLLILAAIEMLEELLAVHAVEEAASHTRRELGAIVARGSPQDL